MKRIIIILNFCFIISVFYLKAEVYGKYHTLIAKIFAVDNVPQIIIDDLFFIQNRLNIIIILFAILSMVIASFCIYKKIYNRMLGSFILVLASIGFLFSLLPI